MGKWINFEMLVKAIASQEKEAELFWPPIIQHVAINETVLRYDRIMRTKHFKGGFMIFGHV